MDIITVNNALYGGVLFNLLNLGLKTGIFNYIVQGKEGRCIYQIYKEFPEYDQEKLLRFLNACVSAGLVEKTSIQEFWVKEECANLYNSKSEIYMGSFVDHMNEKAMDTLRNLGECLKNRISAQSTFDNIYGNTEDTRQFLDAMWGLGYSDAEDIVDNAAFPFYETLLDIGGGSGSFSVAGIKRSKLGKAIVFDLPAVEFYIKEKAKSLALAGKLNFVEGDFFIDEFPQVAAYSLGYILSDWEDDKCIELIKRIYEFAPVGSDVIILEKLFDEGSCSPFNTAMMDICMMVETGGRHRTYAEYVKLLEKSGFESSNLIKSSGEKHAIIGRKVK